MFPRDSRIYENVFLTISFSLIFNLLIFQSKHSQLCNNKERMIARFIVSIIYFIVLKFR